MREGNRRELFWRLRSAVQKCEEERFEGETEVGRGELFCKLHHTSMEKIGLYSGDNLFVLEFGL